MLVYRIAKTKHAEDLSGEGAKLHGGRWNHKLVPCIYTSESRALAALEYSVNANIDFIPRALSIVTIEIPGTAIQMLRVEDLPGNWRQFPAPSSTKDFGSRLLASNTSAVTGIPSSVIPDEYNYLLNPAYTGGIAFTIVDVRDFVFDIRIKLV